MAIALTLARERVEREVELEHVDARLAEEAEQRLVGVLVDERQHLAERQAARRARRAPPAARRSPARCAGRARSRRGHGVDRDARVRGEAVRLAVARSTPLLDRVEESPGSSARGSSRRWTRAVVAVAGRRRARLEVPRGAVNGWPISDEPTTLPLRSTSEPFALSAKRDLGDAGDGERVDEPGAR